jgi:hypothetical protein
MLNLSISTNLY